MAVTFNGNTKLIVIDNGVTSLTALDIYSDWKEWVLLTDNAKYVQAFSVLGGDPLPGSRFLGTTIFLENNWRIRPYEGDHSLDIEGNLYDRGGSTPFVSTIGSYNVLITLTVSNLVDTISTGGSSAITNTDIQSIAANSASQVWDKDTGEVNAANSMGTHVKDDLLKKNTWIGLKD